MRSLKWNFGQTTEGKKPQVRRKWVKGDIKDLLINLPETEITVEQFEQGVY